jgi:hypothetical protein
MALWVVASLIVLLACFIAFAFVYYRPTFERVR